MLLFSSLKEFFGKNNYENKYIALDIDKSMK